MLTFVVGLIGGLLSFSVAMITLDASVNHAISVGGYSPGRTSGRTGKSEYLCPLISKIHGEDAKPAVLQVFGAVYLGLTILRFETWPPGYQAQP